MMRALADRCRRRWGDETGTVSLEFVLVVPVILTFIVLTLEMGLITVRQTMLERGLDITAREIRLGTATNPTHDEIKDLICQNSIFVGECNDKMFLEMDANDARAFTPLNPIAVCTDEELPEGARPARRFVPGQANEVVMLRACLKYTPVFPEALLGRLLEKDGAGEAMIVAVTAFVQEPI